MLLDGFDLLVYGGRGQQNLRGHCTLFLEALGVYRKVFTICMQLHRVRVNRVKDEKISHDPYSLARAF